MKREFLCICEPRDMLYVPQNTDLLKHIYKDLDRHMNKERTTGIDGFIRTSSFQQYLAVFWVGYTYKFKYKRVRMVTLVTWLKNKTFLHVEWIQ